MALRAGSVVGMGWEEGTDDGLVLTHIPEWCDAAMRCGAVSPPPPPSAGADAAAAAVEARRPSWLPAVQWGVGRLLPDEYGYIEGAMDASGRVREWKDEAALHASIGAAQSIEGESQIESACCRLDDFG